MSARELAANILDRLTDEQLEGFILMFKNLVPDNDVPNAETLEAFNEVEDMKRHPEKYKEYDDVDLMFKELLS